MIVLYIEATVTQPSKGLHASIKGLIILIGERRRTLGYAIGRVGTLAREGRSTTHKHTYLAVNAIEYLTAVLSVRGKKLLV